MSGTASESGMTEPTTDPTATTTTTQTSETDPTATTDETTGTTGEGTVCENFATFYAACIGGRDAYDQGLADCEQVLLQAEGISAECELAVANYHACAPSLTCEEFVEGLGCLEEQSAVNKACLPEPGDTCEAYGAKYDECLGDGEGEASYCQLQVNIYGQEYGQECGQAVEDYYACLSELDCADFEDETGCGKAEDAIDDLCV